MKPKRRSPYHAPLLRVYEPVPCRVCGHVIGFRPKGGAGLWHCGDCGYDTILPWPPEFVSKERDGQG